MFGLHIIQGVQIFCRLSPMGIPNSGGTVVENSLRDFRFKLPSRYQVYIYIYVCIGCSERRMIGP
jgi:hypothetical protein